MHTTTWHGFDARDDSYAEPFDIERLIRASDYATNDDFELGKPWRGDPHTLDDDAE